MRQAFSRAKTIAPYSAAKKASVTSPPTAATAWNSSSSTYLKSCASPAATQTTTKIAATIHGPRRKMAVYAPRSCQYRGLSYPPSGGRLLRRRSLSRAQSRDRAADPMCAANVRRKSAGATASARSPTPALTTSDRSAKSPIVIPPGGRALRTSPSAYTGMAASSTGVPWNTNASTRITTRKYGTTNAVQAAMPPPRPGRKAAAWASATPPQNTVLPRMTANAPSTISGGIRPR